MDYSFYEFAPLDVIASIIDLKSKDPMINTEYELEPAHFYRSIYLKRLE